MIEAIGDKYYGRVFVGEKFISIPNNVEILVLPVSDNRSVCVFHIHTVAKR